MLSLLKWPSRLAIWPGAVVACCSVTLFLSPQACAVVQSSRSQKGMVASAHPLASQAGLAMLQQGGNAVDAAVATSFAISVVEPFSAGIGGGGFLLFWSAEQQQMQALDFRERAPLRATRTLYLDAQGQVRPKASVDGHLAVAVPGTVAGLAAVQQRHGRLPWATVVAPAIQLAEQGFGVSDRFTQFTQRRQSSLNPAARKVFTRRGQPYQPGERLVQPDLARTLRAIAENPQNFYRGTIARAIAQDMAVHGGLITLQDLQTYRPTWRPPLCGNFRQTRICSMPPPSSGGVHLIEILNLIGEQNLVAQGRYHPDTLHLLAEAMKIAYADRAVYLGDPAFFPVPVTVLTSPAYAQIRRREIRLDRARTATEVKAADPALIQTLSRRQEPQDTSHLTVVDQQRNAVSLTFTVNLSFGSGVMVPGTGILLNNEMDDFATAPQVPNAFGLVGDAANAIAPGKIPLSSMTPVIATEQGHLRLAVGAPGGSTIITTVLQILLNLLVFRQDAAMAVAAPRLHHQWLPDQLSVERGGFQPAILEELRRRGHQIQERNAWGNANVIVVTPEGKLEGAADPRGEGVALGDP